MLAAPRNADFTFRSIPEVLPHCEYEPFYEFFIGARDEFIDRQGLTDLQEFCKRSDYTHKQEALAFRQVYEKENLREFFAGLTRMAINAKYVFDDVVALLGSSQLSGLALSLGYLTPQDATALAMRGLAGYATVKGLWADGMYRAAGKAAVDALVERAPESEPTTEFREWQTSLGYEGELEAGVMDGLLESFTETMTYDNLAACMSNRTEFGADVERAGRSLADLPSSAVGTQNMLILWVHAPIPCHLVSWVAWWVLVWS